MARRTYYLSNVKFPESPDFEALSFVFGLVGMCVLHATNIRENVLQDHDSCMIADK